MCGFGPVPHTTDCKLAAAIAWIERHPGDNVVTCNSFNYVVYDDDCPESEQYLMLTTWRRP
jgi:hypothetical protein